jgi:cell fate (sporulation/competence/biofilm development) regulator YlbF (YheA/YmcA/DUF963 family)
MALTEELKQAALTLGKALADSPEIEAYNELKEAVTADDEAKNLETELNQLYESLITRQRSGEKLTSEEINQFNTMRYQVAMNPKIMERNAGLSAVKNVFMDAGVELSQEIGLDFVNFVLE